MFGLSAGTDAASGTIARSDSTSAPTPSFGESVTPTPAATPTRPGSLPLLIGAAILTVLCGALIGYAAGEIVDVARRSYLNAVGSPHLEGSPSFFILQPIAVLIGFVGYGVYRRANRAHTGRTDRYALAGALTLLLLGATIGMAFQVLVRWVPADQVGATADIFGGTPIPWEIMTWGLYSMQFWIVPVLAIITIIAFVAGRPSGQGAEQRREVASELLQSGKIADGVVVQGDDEPAPGQGF